MTASESIAVDDFVRQFWNCGPNEVSSGTRLYQDLSIHGDDAIDLLLEIERRWGTDLREFPFDEYFPGEHANTLSFMLPWFFRPKKSKELTIGHLARVVNHGRWVEPEPE